MTSYRCRFPISVAAIAVMLGSFLVSTPAAAAEPTDEDWSRVWDCRYIDPSGPSSQEGGKYSILPTDDVFRPLLASVKEPRIFGEFRHTDFERSLNDGDLFDDFTMINVGLGESGGMWTWRKRESCDGLQINIFGGAFSQFAIDPLFLLNVDYIGGLSMTSRIGEFSSRLRIYHQSSHLGDDFIFESPDFDDQNLSFEAVDLLFSITHLWWRIYGGGGYVFRADPRDMQRLKIQFGMEVRSSQWVWKSFIPQTTWTPVAGVDLSSFRIYNMGLTVSAKGGVELIGPHDARRMRFLLAVLYGHMPYGQFYDDHRLLSVGLDTQFSF